jgi:DNA-binding response OmpR family regulator
MDMTEQTEKILLVDTDQDLLMQLSYHLQRAGYQVLLAENGQEALEKAQKENPALTILDLVMPDIAGVEVCRRLRKAHLSMFVIILTAMDSPNNHIAGLEAGADDYILKPVNPKELVLRVKAVLRRNNRAEQPQPTLQEPQPANSVTNQTDQLKPIPNLLNRQFTTAPLSQSSSLRPGYPEPAPENPQKDVLNEVLQDAAQQAQIQDSNKARELYLQALKLDPNNETALIWLAWHTPDPYEGVRFLESLVENHPENAQFQEYLEAGQKRCQELDQLISGSGVLGYWTMAEKIQQDRIQKGTDRRSASVTPVGQLLLKKGIITVEQLETAVVVQEMFTRLGESKKLGEVLVEYGYLTQGQLEAVLSEQITDFNSNFY